MSNARDLLAAYRSQHDYAPARAEATWRELENRIEAGDGLDLPLKPREEMPDGGTPSRPVSKRRVAVGVALLSLAAAAVGVLWTRSVPLIDADPPKGSTSAQAAFEASAPRASGETRLRPRRSVGAKATNIDGSAGRVVADEPHPGAAHEPRPPEPSGTPSPAKRPVRPSASEPSASEATPTPSIERELALLRRAQLALGRSDPASALLHLEAHADQFASGSLAPERQGLRAVVLCELGRAEAESAARSFLAEHPGSGLVTRVRTACARSTENSSDAVSRNRTSHDK